MFSQHSSLKYFSIYTIPNNLGDWNVSVVDGELCKYIFFSCLQTM